MIKRIYIDNYKTFVNLMVNFDSINVLLGKNASGKSNLFDMVYKLKKIILGEAGVKELFSLETLTRWQKLNLQTFELELELQGHQYIYHLEIEYDIDSNKNRVSKESLTYDGNDNKLFLAENGRAYLYNDAFMQKAELLINLEYSGVGLIQERNDNKLLSTFKKAVQNIIICQLRPYLFESATNKECSFPDYHFANFTSVFKFMLQSSPNKISELCNELKAINSTFNGVSLTGHETRKVLKIIFNLDGSTVDYTLDEFSDGEKALFALYFLLICYKNANAVLLLDEPENYITLSEIQPILHLIEEFTQNDSQCLLISHHPEVLDYFVADCGIWLERTKYGMTKLVAQPKVDKAITVSEYIRRGWNVE